MLGSTRLTSKPEGYGDSLYLGKTKKKGKKKEKEEKKRKDAQIDTKG